MLILDADVINGEDVADLKALFKKYLFDSKAESFLNFV